MGVSLSGSDLTMVTVRRLAAGVVVLFCTLGYLYGPPAMPGLRDAAAAQCNAHSQGNFRSFRLGWQVGVLPHWTCGDASHPGREPVSLGWWTSPF